MSRGIRIEHDIVVYYGSPAGFIRSGKAVVDPMFCSQELKDFLNNQFEIQSVEWKEGIFERLCKGQIQEHSPCMLKSCRVWQLRPESDILKRFISYEETISQFGSPRLDDYQLVYDGEVDSNDLETLCVQLNTDTPPEFSGHPISISDVVELYDEGGGEFYYCDRAGFQLIEF